MELKEPHQMLRRWGGCKAILTLALLMLLSVATAGRAAAEETKKAYAVLKGNTLTFYYDDGYSEGENTWAFPNPGKEPEWAYYTDITEVVITKDFHNFTPESCKYWFECLGNLKEIKGIENINTSKVTSMSYMFNGCQKLTSLDLSSFNTAKVTDMSGMFDGCEKLTSLDLSSFNTANVTNMNSMFGGCFALTSLDLSSFNTASVTDMSYMFLVCSALTSLDLSSFNTARVQSMLEMFSGCSALTTILVDRNLWKIKDGASGEYMFYGCNNLVGGNGTKCDGDNNFDLTYAIVDGNGGEGYLTSKSQCEPYAMLKDNGDGGTKTLRFCFGYKPEGAMELTLPSYAFGIYIWPWSNNNDNITKVEFDNLFKYARPESCAGLFNGCTNLTVIKGIENLNTSEVTNMSGMFGNCSALTSLDLSSFNTAKVTDMSGMFSGCKALTLLDLSSFNTAEVTDMIGMFLRCSALTSLNLSSFNTASVLNMYKMFASCSALTSLDLSSFNTASVTDMRYMFEDCSALTTILVDEKLWIVGGVSGDDMFLGCNSLVGGNGTTYLQEQITDIDYAIIDGKDGNLGYLTSIGQCEPYAMVVDNGKTLRFCFGPEVPEGAMELQYTYDDENSILIWTWSSNKDDITKVEFDNLFRHARPERCTDWFNGFTKLTEIKGIENLNTSEVQYMGYMFFDCKALTSLNLGSFNTASVQGMGGMFEGCSALTSLDLSSFNTAKVENMGSMFYGCQKLTSLDLSSFNTASVTNMSFMFEGCSALTTILVDRNLWKIGSNCVGTLMFDGCTNLVGGNGTKYNENIINKTYARVDGDGNKPGYLTHNALKITKSDGTTTAEIQGDFEYSIGAALLLDKDIKVSKVTFKREFTQGVTATIMLPFSFTVGNNINGTFHTLESVAKGENGVWTAKLSGPITNIQANTPYIFYPKEDITSMEFTGDITLLHLTDDLTNGANDGWQLHGVYSKKIWTEDSKTEYGFAGEKVEADGIEAGEFVRAGKGASADPMRCYLTYEGNDKPFTAKSSVVLPDRIRVVFPQDPDDDITPATDPDEVITPVSSVSEPDEIKVWSFGGTVFIEAQPDMDYTIVDLSGRIIKKGITHSTREEVSLNAKGIVIVKIANKSFKIK